MFSRKTLKSAKKCRFLILPVRINMKFNQSFVTEATPSRCRVTNDSSTDSLVSHKPADATDAIASPSASQVKVIRKNCALTLSYPLGGATVRALLGPRNDSSTFVGSFRFDFINQTSKPTILICGLSCVRPR